MNNTDFFLYLEPFLYYDSDISNDNDLFIIPVPIYILFALSNILFIVGEN